MTTPGITDPRLLAELASYDAGNKIGRPGSRAVFMSQLEERQAHQDAQAQQLASMKREQRRRHETAIALTDDPANQSDLRHMHSVLAICGMPYERMPLDQREFKRMQGNMSVTIEAGSLDNADGASERQPIPFGPKARLLMMHLCSEAVRQKSPKIEIAETLTGFVRDMGFPDSGGRKGPMTAFKEQINALAAARIRLSTWTDQSQRTRFVQPFDQIDLWLPKNPAQRMLWPSTITFSDGFYRSLEQHAMPVNIRAVKAFAGSARKLDMLFWLGYRLHSLQEPLTLTWGNLTSQWGQGFTRERDFQRRFTAEMQALKEAFPRLSFTLTEKGMVLQPTGADVLGIPARRAVKKA